ncbi:hypothetical protein BDN70DRAFT_938442 [Pholiota conissans]|uniref:Uncharacterized protein n=1 Tax=Pholiota conissans TaxID=109636 RepID=A0A9P6CTY9_9AGAR|nr:hypothetical protein BDN70DRAFT_938442 [Pholiota conissans]
MLRVSQAHIESTDAPPLRPSTFIFSAPRVAAYTQYVDWSFTKMSNASTKNIPVPSDAQRSNVSPDDDPEHLDAMTYSHLAFHHLVRADALSSRQSLANTPRPTSSHLISVHIPFLPSHFSSLVPSILRPRTSPRLPATHRTITLAPSSATVFLPSHSVLAVPSWKFSTLRTPSLRQFLGR